MSQFTPDLSGRVGDGGADGRARVVASRRVSATRTTVPRDGRRLQRPQCADRTFTYGAGVAGVG
jgi:hypothetical protein